MVRFIRQWLKAGREQQQTHHDHARRQYSDEFWVTHEYFWKKSEWKLLFHYESFFQPSYPSPGCSRDDQFNVDFAALILNAIEREFKTGKRFSGHCGCPRKFLVYLTNGHGQILHSSERVIEGAQNGS